MFSTSGVHLLPLPSFHKPVGVVTRRSEAETRIASPDPYFKKVKKV
ncbi:hypothetical protein [Paraflavitalea pollutisoli]|nr:hypothetical protein [Paraflavitalea sp. H1-2-19X]